MSVGQENEKLNDVEQEIADTIAMLHKRRENLDRNLDRAIARTNVSILVVSAIFAIIVARDFCKYKGIL